MSNEAMRYDIVVEPGAAAELEQALIAGLVAYNTEQAGSSHHQVVAIAVRDGEGNICGGLSGAINWNWLFVKLLWVGESLRGQGYGTALIAAAEREALAHGCDHVYLDTFSFQARGFYERLGYAVFGQLEDFPPGHTRYFLQKRIGVGE